MSHQNYIPPHTIMNTNSQHLYLKVKLLWNKRSRKYIMQLIKQRIQKHLQKNIVNMSEQ